MVILENVDLAPTETYTLYVVFPEGELLYDLERTSPQEIKVYPNPVRRGESVQLQLTEAYKVGLLRLYFVDGVLIKTEIVTNPDLFYLKLPDVLPGLYLLQITGKAQIIILRYFLGWGSASSSDGEAPLPRAGKRLFLGRGSASSSDGEMPLPRTGKCLFLEWGSKM
jgi:hypothetical protein